ncbi:hypothetical protein EV177_009776, partial [Coemansia sp. RSA 1804]
LEPTVDDKPAEQSAAVDEAIRTTETDALTKDVDTTEAEQSVPEESVVAVVDTPEISEQESTDLAPVETVPDVVTPDNVLDAAEVPSADVSKAQTEQLGDINKEEVAVQQTISEEQAPSVSAVEASVPEVPSTETENLAADIDEQRSDADREVTVDSTPIVDQSVPAEPTSQFEQAESVESTEHTDQVTEISTTPVEQVAPDVAAKETAEETSVPQVKSDIPTAENVSISAVDVVSSTEETSDNLVSDEPTAIEDTKEPLSTSEQETTLADGAPAIEELSTVQETAIDTPA